MVDETENNGPKTNVSATSISKTLNSGESEVVVARLSPNAEGAKPRTESLLPVEIETLTVATEPQNRDRKKLGIGEEVKLTLKSPSDAVVTWALKSGDHGEVIKPLGYGPAEALFIASETEKEATVEATLTNYGNAKVSVTFDVIRPKTIFFEKVGGRGIFWDANNNGIGMELELDWYFGPDDVCFYALEAGETGPNTNVTGWFAKAEHNGHYANMYHEEWIGAEVLRRAPMPPITNSNNNGLLSKTVVKGKGTKGSRPDTATAGASQPPSIDSAGRFEWPIEWKWRVKGKTGSGTPFAPATQWFELEAGSTNTGDGTIQFQGKGGKGNVTAP